MRKRAKDEEARGVPLPHDVRVLTHEQAQAFYNRMGAKQDCKRLAPAWVSTLTSCGRGTPLASSSFALFLMLLPHQKRSEAGAPPPAPGRHRLPPPPLPGRGEGAPARGNAPRQRPA